MILTDRLDFGCSEVIWLAISSQYSYTKKIWLPERMPVDGWVGHFFFWQSIQFGSWSLSMDIISMMISLSFALYACIVFVLWTIGIKIDRRIPALLFVFSQLTILVWVIYSTDTLTLRTLLWWQIYLGVLYGVLQQIHSAKWSSIGKYWLKNQEDLLQLILRWERIHEQKTLTSSATPALYNVIVQ